MIRNLIGYSQRLAGLLLLLGLVTCLAQAQGRNDLTSKDEGIRLRVTVPGAPGEGIGGTIDAFGSDQTLTNVPSTTGGGGGAGKAQFSPLVITKAIDSATPKLFLLAATGQHLPQVQISWIRKSPHGGDEIFFTVILQDVLVSAVHSSLPNQHDPNLQPLGPVEEISFSFSTIQWIYTQPDGTQIKAGFNTKSS